MNKVLLSNKFTGGQVNELLVYLLICALKNSSQQQEEIAQLVRIIMEKIHGGQDCETEQQKVNQIVSTLYI